MKTLILRMTILALTSLAVVGCCSPQRAAQPPALSVAGFSTDLAAFEQFIATAPTPEQFRARYPDVTLVLPGSIATKELRSNRSRYFADVDSAGRITDGKFQ